MSPLSIWTYYWNNKRKVFPLTGIIALSIVGIASSGTLTGSLYQDQEREIAFFDYYSLVFSSQRAGLSGPILEKLDGHSSVANALRMERRTTPRQGLFGREGTPIYFLSEFDKRPFADRLTWDLVEGRWPQPGTNELAITENFLRNRGLGVGDRMGQAVDDADWLNGEWLIVGAFGATEVIGGLGDLDFLRERFLAQPGVAESLQDQPHLLALAPVAGQETQMEALLDSLPKDEVFVIHRSIARRNFENLTRNIDTIVWILNAMSIAVIALALGLLNVIFFMQRANEFGLLAALGYTKRFLMRRVFTEAAVTVAMGWVLGILLSIGIYSALNTFIFIPRGL
ncbi:MAG: hypothetical protein IH872_05595, partial [Chloroflexi bacterium]|nr:hypothetical protein [Chloroflexota bacterium]